MADINVSTQVLRDTAAKLKGINAALDERLKTINSTMDALGSTYQSSASEEIRGNMNALKPRFEEYYNVVESYAVFLEQTAEQYEGTEATIKNNASQFKQV